jgi:hypothetical protein
MPRSGEQIGGGKPARASSEAEIRSRGRLALERGGASPEGASSPRVRRSLTRGGASLEGASSPRARQSLTRGASSPRARRSFVSAVSYPSSEAEFRPRMAGADCSGGLLGPPGPWAPATDSRLFWACFTFVSSFMFCYLRKKMGFPQLFRGPLWLSPTVALSLCGGIR